MRYTVSADSFLEIPVTTGTIQNVSSTDIEVSNEEVVGSGLVLKAGEMVGFNNATVYVCARPVLEGGTGIISVVPFSIKGEGGGGGEYILPIATKNTLGGIKVGNGLQIDSSGVLSCTASPDNSVVPWTAGTEYKVGQYVIYDNTMYECIEANDDSTFDADKWQVIGGSGGVSITDWVAGKKYKADELVIYNNTLYKCITANEDDEFTPAKWQVIGGVGTNIDDWQKNHDYEIGNLVIYDDKIYQCATEHKSGDTFDSEKWTEIGDAGNVQAWEAGTSYAVDDFAIYNNRLYQCTTANDDTEFDPDNWQDMGAIQHTVEAWESGKSYAVGDLVLKDNVIYKCKTANDDTTFDPDNWTVEIDNDKSVTPWVSGTDYAVGKYVVYDNKIWECKTANDDDEFDEEKWTEISAATGIVLEQWAKNTSYKTNQLVEHDGYAYLCLIAHTSTADFDDDFDAKYWRRMPSYVMKGADSANDGIEGLVPQPKKTDVDKFLRADGKWKYARLAVWQPNTGYEVNDVVIYNYVIYMCREAHTSATDFEYNKWIPMSGEGSSNNPIGTIIPYMGNTPPSDYLACDGTIYNITDYQDLADHINTQFGSYNFFGGNGTTTFAVPDLRGEFLRGTGTNSHTNQGSGASVGEHQDGTVTNALRVDSNRGYILGSSVNAQTYNFDSDLGANTRVSASNNFSTTSLGGGSLYTSRPTNTSVLYCIKYKNSGITYSTGEQRIGTWIDGKPLYQKTIVDTMPTVTTEGIVGIKRIDISSLHVKCVANICTVLNSSTHMIPISSINSTDSNFYRYIYFDKQDSSKDYFDRMTIGESQAVFSNKPVYITIQYTKTTD